MRDGAAEASAAPPAAGPGSLFLIPTPLAAPRVRDGTEGPGAWWLTETDRARVAGLRQFAVETPKTARAWLAALLPGVAIASLRIRPLPSPGAPEPDWSEWLSPLRRGESIGLLSDAGCPGIADPGAGLVAAVHAESLPVRPLVGPSSIVLALMASGLEGQRFCFHGYLPVAAAAREASLRLLARRARDQAETQVMIETPYRNQALLEAMLRTLPDPMVLVVACDLTGSQESIRRASVRQWRDSPTALPKLPALFLFGTAPQRGRSSPLT